MKKLRRIFYYGFIWSCACGLLGLVVGYFGNMILAKNPGNMVPIMGLLFTGPQSFMIGLVCGLLVGVTNFSKEKINMALIVLLLIIAYRSANMIKPGFEIDSRLVKGSILSCSENIHEYVTSKIGYWESEVDRISKVKPELINVGWEAKLNSLTSSRPGLIFEFKIEQYSWIKVRKWRWKSEDWMIGPWERPKTEVGISDIEYVFYDDLNPSCNDIAITNEGYYWLNLEKDNSFPPLEVSAFLQMAVIHSVPEKFQKFLQE